IVDSSGDLFGTTQSGGAAGGGTGFGLSPPPARRGAFPILAAPSGSGGPSGDFLLSTAWNLYPATTGAGSDGFRSVFELTLSNGRWTYRSLHDFSGGMDGATPYSSLLLGANGILYGTTSAGGAYGQGVIFQIDP